jgi:FkbM family methyltransferase
MANTDPVEVEGLLWNGWPGRIALDVGARMGESIEDIVRCGFTNITCFEPSPQAFPILEPFAERLGVKPRQLAISDHDGQVLLASVPGAMSKGELVSPIDGMEWSVDDWSKADYVVVPCLTLNTWCGVEGFPDFVKVDTEGHELKVLQGAQELIWHGCGWLIEFHTPLNRERCSGLLQTAGYEVETIRHPHYAPESPMWHQHGWIRAEK